MRHHARACVAVAGAVLVAVAATACSDGSSNSNSGSTSAQSADSTVAAAAATQSPAATVQSKKGDLGTLLFTNKGQTLYLFQADKTNKSTCTGACAAAWPPYIVSGKPTAGSGVKQDKLSTTTRSDGKTQVTYNNHPLYRFSGDSKAGQMNGQGLSAFGALWYVVDTNGKQVTMAPATPGVSGY